MAAFFEILEFEIAVGEAGNGFLGDELASFFELVIFEKYFVIVLLLRVGPEKDVSFIKSIELDATKGVGFND